MSKEILSRVLSELINRSFEHGIFPDCLKLAKVTPIPKTGDDREVNNFRPTPYYLLFQKCLREQCALECTLTLSVLISSKVLFGYRGDRSTVDAIIQIFEKIRDDDQFLCNCLFLDLSNAFDTLDHERLIMKLELYGIDHERLIDHELLIMKLERYGLPLNVSNHTSKNGSSLF